MSTDVEDLIHDFADKCREKMGLQQNLWVNWGSGKRPSA